MDMDKEEQLAAEYKYLMTHYGFALQLVINRSMDDIIQVDPMYQGQDTMEEFIFRVVDEAANYMTGPSSKDYIDTGGINGNLSSFGHSAYHSESNRNVVLENWHVKVSNGSSLCPGLILCENGSLNESNLQELSDTIAKGIEVEYARAIELIKSQMATMTL